MPTTPLSPPGSTPLSSPRARTRSEPAEVDTTADKTHQAVQQKGLLRRAMDAGVQGIKKVFTEGANLVARNVGLDPETYAAARQCSLEVSLKPISRSIECTITWNGGIWKVVKDLDHEPTSEEKKQWEQAMRATGPEFLDLVQAKAPDLSEQESFDVEIESEQVNISFSQENISLTESDFRGPEQRIFTAFVKTNIPSRLSVKKPHVEAPLVQSPPPPPRKKGFFIEAGHINSQQGVAAVVVAAKEKEVGTIESRKMGEKKRTYFSIVGPKLRKKPLGAGLSDEDQFRLPTEQDQRALFDVVQNTLQQAQEQGLRSIAFPGVISEGYPLQESIQIIYRAAQQYIQSFDAIKVFVPSENLEEANEAIRSLAN